MPGRSAAECSERFYQEHPTPDRGKRKANAEGKCGAHGGLVGGSPWKDAEEDEDNEEGLGVPPILCSPMQSPRCLGLVL